MLDVIYQDDHLVAVHKPSGLLVHRSQLDRHASEFAVQMLRDQLGRHVHPVHRLDRATSGVLLFAFDTDVARRLGESFMTRAVHKSYLAVVRGTPDEQGEVEHALRVRDDLPGRATRHPPAAAQPALTRFRRLAACELPFAVDRYPTARYALMGLVPESGRRHQLRRHMKHLSHPVIGDSTYGKSRHNRFFAQQFGCSRLLLAAVELRLPHPLDGTPLRLCAPPSADFSAVLTALGWQTAADRWLRVVRTPA